MGWAVRWRSDVRSSASSASGRRDCLRRHSRRADGGGDEAARERTRSPGVPRSLHATTEREGTRASDPSSTAARLPKWVVSGSALVIVISLTLQAGPLLTEFAISHGMERHKSLSVIVVCACCTRPRVRQCLLPTSAGQRHGQALFACHARPPHSSLHAVPATQPGLLHRREGRVLMSRMTSDIENLQQLIQDGISQFALQDSRWSSSPSSCFSRTSSSRCGPCCSWCPPRRLFDLVSQASEKGYLLARDRIANVLADLSSRSTGFAS